MRDDVEKRGKLIRQLEDALALTEELNDPMTGFLIERAVDEARAQQFRPSPKSCCRTEKGRSYRCPKCLGPTTVVEAVGMAPPQRISVTEGRDGDVIHLRI